MLVAHRTGIKRNPLFYATGRKATLKYYSEVTERPRVA
jgi:hypothetical protein